MNTGLRAKRKPRQKGDAELLAGGKNVFRGPVAEVVFSRFLTGGPTIDVAIHRGYRHPG